MAGNSYTSNSKPMQQQLLRFLKNALLLLVLLFAADRLIGMGLERLFYKQQHGDDANTMYVLGEAKEDILIFGSSRASHHYQSTLIAQQTGMSCFNAGRDEMTITYMNALLPEIYKRYTPKLLVLEIVPTELSAGPDNAVVYQRISTVLLPFAHRYPTVKPTVALVGDTELWKLRASHIYPYNSLIGSMVQNTYTQLGHFSEKGYEPLYASIDSANYTKPMWGDFTARTGVDSLQQATLQAIINTTKAHGSRLVVVISPFYFPHTLAGNDSYDHIKKLTAANNIPFYDFSADSSFVLHPQLFKDDVHLNDSGARLFTQHFLTRLAVANP